MAAKLKVRQEHLESEVHYQWNGSIYKVALKDATPEQLNILNELKMDIFEGTEKVEKSK